MSKPAAEAPRGEDRTPGAPEAPSLMAPLLLVGLWSVLFNLVGRLSWGWGALTFACLMGSFFLLCFVHPLTRALDARLRGRRGLTNAAITRLAAFVIVLYLALDAQAFVQEWRNERNETYLIDIGANTYEAARWFFDEGVNPYAHRSQMWDFLSPELPNVTLDGDRTLLYGVPYPYGFPYFPMMFMTLEPARRLVEGYHAVRWANAAYYLLNAGLIALICRRLLAPGVWRAGALLAVLAFLSERIFPVELFQHGVIDLILSSYGLLGFLAMAHGRPLTSGAIFGMAFGCKLLPGPWWFTLAAIAWWKRAGWRASAKFSAMFTLVSGAIILPFVLWDPPAFWSSTILYFMTAKHAGDDTALWYFMPEPLKAPFLIVGGLWIGAVFMAFLLRGRPTVADTIRFSFLTYAVFIAFNRQSHLNHLWSIYAMGCVALVLMSLQSLTGGEPAEGPGKTGGEDETEAHRL